MRIIKIIAISIQIVLYCTTMFLAIIWCFSIQIPIDAEAGTFILLTLISPSISFLVKMYSNEIKTESFSTANALAYGYINNFVEPVLTQLIKSGKNPLLNIYIPEHLSELYSKNVDRTIANFSKKVFNIKTKSIKLNEGRGARDIMTIGIQQDKEVFFDFPNTLLTLEPLIDFKIKSLKNDFNEQEKSDLGKLYINAFKGTIMVLLNEKNLTSNVNFINKNYTK